MIVTADEIREMFRYDPETGEFQRAVTRGQWRAGQVAGTRHNQGYWQISIRGRTYLAHRLAWLYMTGKWPQADIDHRNGDRGDTRFSNLREATRAENKQNENAPIADSASGLRGVNWHKAGKGWEARIRAGGVRRHLGIYESKYAAHAAYMAAKKSLHPFSTDRI